MKLKLKIVELCVLISQQSKFIMIRGSGENIERPAVQQFINDIEQDIIKKLLFISYTESVEILLISINFMKLCKSMIANL